MITIKRIIALLLAFLLLASCTAPPAALPEDERTADQILSLLLEYVPERTEDYLTMTEDSKELFLQVYGLESEQVSDLANARLGGARVFEIAVARSAEGCENTVKHALETYLVTRARDFTGYEPYQAMLAESGAVFAYGSWVILVISEDMAAAHSALAACFELSEAELPPPPSYSPSPEPTIDPTPEPVIEPTPEPTPTFTLPNGWYPYAPPYTDDMTLYDTSAIQAAWQSGSADGLSPEDLAIYLHCQEVIEEVIEEGMSEFQREWAIYRWITAHASYDWRHNDPVAETPRTSFTPQGILLYGEAVCLGFASTFQLFMDLLDVECITVIGAAYNSTGDHAWNMVRLNGEWYCVDTTWDLGRHLSPATARYFNVTSDFLARHEHQWDYENVPLATATDHGNS